LIKDRGLPAELEVVVFDLWALRVIRLEHRISDVTNPISSQTYSSASETEDSGPETTNQPSRKKKEREKKLQKTPTMLDTLALIYFGVITLRLPITPGDIKLWVSEGELPYRTAIKLVPPPMRDKLPAHYHAYLDPSSPLRITRFYDVLLDLEIAYEKEYGVVWPSLNTPLLLWRYMKDLALPLEVYEATMRLGKCLEYTFTFPTADTAEKQGRLGVRYMPEAQLAACLIFVVKLFYPFDSPLSTTRRFPVSATHPSATSLDWDDWYKHISLARKEREAKGIYSSEELENLKEGDVFDMSSQQIDQYLDFYAENFIDETRTKGDEARRALWDMFPIDNTNPTAHAQTPNPETPSASSNTQDTFRAVHVVHANMQPSRIIPSADDLPTGAVRPGENYVLYKKSEDLPEQARRFYEEVAKVAGLDVDVLVLAVFFAEKKMERWGKDKKKGARRD
jgi:RNA polymerase I-specific transcription initiation factor RRN7